VNGPSVDLPKLRAALRRMDRGDLLLFAERAVEIAAAVGGIEALVGDRMRIPFHEGEPTSASLLEEVSSFHAACLRGEYYESFEVNWRNCSEHSKGTDAFIAETDRLLARCLQATEAGLHEQARQAFELLFELLRGIDDAPDRIVFFADEAGSWQVPVDWGRVLPAYFCCVSDGGSTAEDFARLVDRAITDFGKPSRGRFLLEAERMANAEQREALAALPQRDAR
jgi:hypothetical protein